jgi:GntR family transcriptional regulator / MocR family aminotransferase
MTKRVKPSAKPDITLDQRLAAPLYRQLYERLRAQIVAGQLEARARLPSTRTLASELGVSRNTTALAYEMLLLEGYIESRVGDGTRVALAQPEPKAEASSSRAPGRDSAPGSSVRIGRRGQSLLGVPYPGQAFGARSNGMGDIFRAGQPDVATFPFEIWARLVTKHARHSTPAAALYQPPQGYAPLREAIAAHIGITRGVRCSPEQIIITSGSQGALDLAARVLLDPGDHAWVEAPGYLGARGALVAAGAQQAPIPVDDEGLSVEAGRALRPDARLAVVTPSHQFPTGVTMSLRRRLALLEWAREARAWIIEDDYDSEYRYSGRPLEALYGLDATGCVAYIGSFSKTLFPAMRLGYIVVPEEVALALVAARRFIDAHPSPLEQMALADFIAEGHFARHLRRMRLVYRERRDALIGALRQDLGDLLDVAAPEAGMHLAAWLPAGVSAHTVGRLAAEQGIGVLPFLCPGVGAPQREGLLFGFASATPAELRAGVQRLASVMRSSATRERVT